MNSFSWLLYEKRFVIMEEISRFFLTEEEKNEFIEALTPELALLRAEAEISQEEIANLIGVSRQTYGSIERKARKMSWNTYLSLILFYDYNKKTHKMIRNISAFPHELIKRFNEGEEPVDFELNMLFKADTKNIIDSLDEQAISTLKTILMVEYSRCNNISGEAVVKFFEGVDFTKREISEKQEDTAQALKNIKRNN